MGNRIKIEFSSNPAPFYVLSFGFVNTSLSYANSIAKVFITGIPSSSNEIRIGATLGDTMNNLLLNLVTYNLDGNVTYYLNSYDNLYLDFNIPDVYDYTIIDDTTIPYPTFSLETITIPSPVTLDPLEYDYLSIRIFDTYYNTRILQTELASANACKITWDGGDDMYKSIMASVCDFNMLVGDASDAYFIHLFSGDEQRYRAEVVGVTTSLTEQLIWQGFILPDQYKEPYQQVNFFVEFTASDMINSMKGKYLKPWFYQNTMPIAEVLGYCLKETGLAQNMIVKPSVVPDSDFYLWQSICVNLKTFVDGESFDDCYKIIEDILQSNAMTLYSYRGYWWLEGIHRKGEITTTNYQFDVDGFRIEDIITTKIVVDCAALLQPTPMFNAITPWRRVNIGFDLNGTKNLYSDNIVALDKSSIYSTVYSSGGYTGAAPSVPVTEVYNVGKIKDWIASLNADFLYVNSNFKKLMWKTTLFSGTTYSDFIGGYEYYNYTEAMVLSNYIECKEKPFVKPGVLYELNAEFFAEHVNIDINPNNKQKIEEKLAAGDYDKFFPIQVFINGVEKFSNRPSFGGSADLRYNATSQITGYGQFACDFTFKLKYQFKVETEGLLGFRILMPILLNGISSVDDIDDLTSISRSTFFYCNELKLTVVDGYDENGTIVADRDINYTQEKNYDLPITCTVDNSVVNSFKLGYPIDANYFNIIYRTNTAYSTVGYNYFSPTTLLTLNLNTFKIDYYLLDLLFAEGKLKNCYLENASGVESLFSSLWYFFNNPISRLGYLTSYTGYPVIPKNYEKYPSVVSGDILRYMHIKYAAENYANRLQWKLFNGTIVDSFPKTIAKVVHGIHHQMIYRLEAEALNLLFPDCLIDFYFDNNDRNFIPTTLKLDLFNRKTNFVATEDNFIELTDIIYG